MNRFPDRLKMLRQEKELSQQELSLKLNVPRTTLSSWELGTRNPDLTNLQALSDFFNVSVDYLLGRNDIRNPLHTNKVSQNIFNAIKDDPELEDFIEKLIDRNELKIISQEIKNLSKDSIMRLIRVIKAIETDNTTS